MKINKNSWHFKLQEKYDTVTSWCLYRELPVSLCGYFWSTVGCLLLGLKDLLLYGSCAFFLILALSMVISPLYFFLVAFTGLDILGQAYSEFGMYATFYLVLAAIVFGVGFTVTGKIKVWPKWLPVYKLFTKSKPAKTKQPSLFLEYFKAKKAKICPLIKLEK